jgi:hypothetical protein
MQDHKTAPFDKNTSSFNPEIAVRHITGNVVSFF